MDLLSTILRSCNAEQYGPNFRSHQVDSFTLKLLSHEDLEIIGIHEVEHRNQILAFIENLQIPSEKRVNTKVDNGYVLLILNQMSLQLHKYYAAITYNLKREDVDLCNARVAPVATCLQNCLLSLDKELDKFEQKMISKTNHKKMGTKGHLLIFPTIATTAIVLVLYRFFIVYST